MVTIEKRQRKARDGTRLPCEMAGFALACCPSAAHGPTITF